MQSEKACLIRIALSILAINQVMGRAYGGIIDVWLMAGQSNMVGGGNFDQLPLEFQVPQNDVPYWYWIDTNNLLESAGWEVLHPFTPGFGSTFSAEITFGRALADALPDRLTAIVKVASNGSSLFRDWNPDSTTGKLLYTTLIGEMSASLQSLQMANPADSVRLAGMVWVQGESDANTIENATGYADNMAAFLEAVRFDFDKPDLSIIFNSLHVNSIHEFNTELRASQTIFAASDSLAYMVSGDDLTLRADRIHLDGTSRLALGERFAAIAVSLQLPRGDMNGDRLVDSFDVSLFEAALVGGFNETAASGAVIPGIVGDMNRNGVFDAFDVALFESVLAIGEGAVPQPASIGFLVFGVLATIHRRSHQS